MRSSEVIRLERRASEVNGQVERAATTFVRRREDRGWRFAHFSWGGRATEVRVRCFREKKEGCFAGVREGTLFSSEISSSVRSPNKALEPTPMAVTSRADARLAPATVVAHL